MITIDEIADFVDNGGEARSMEEWMELRRRIDEGFGAQYGTSKEDLDRYGDYEEIILTITSDD